MSVVAPVPPFATVSVPVTSEPPSATALEDRTPVDVPGLPYQRPSWERAAEIARTLHRRGILTKLRQSAGQDVDGGCGQLRARDGVQRVRIVRSPVPGLAA